MKILVKDQEKETMYIQVHDIIALKERNLSIPFSKDVVENIYINPNLYDINEFIAFNEQRAINMLKAYDFIISYDELKQYTEEELVLNIKRLESTISNINESLAKKESEHLKRNKIFLLRCKLLLAKLDHLKALLEEKTLNKDLIIPESITNKKR